MCRKLFPNINSQSCRIFGLRHKREWHLPRFHDKPRIGQVLDHWSNEVYHTFVTSTIIVPNYPGTNIILIWILRCLFFLSTLGMYLCMRVCEFLFNWYAVHSSILVISYTDTSSLIISAKSWRNKNPLVIELYGIKFYPRHILVLIGQTFDYFSPLFSLTLASPKLRFSVPLFRLQFRPQWIISYNPYNILLSPFRFSGYGLIIPNAIPAKTLAWNPVHS